MRQFLAFCCPSPPKRCSSSPVHGCCCSWCVQIQGYLGPESLAGCLAGADLVLIPAGVPRKPGMTRDDLFNINAGIVKNLAQACAEHCPNVSAARGLCPGC